MTKDIVVPDWTKYDGAIYRFLRIKPETGEFVSPELYMYDDIIDIPWEYQDDNVTSIEFTVKSLKRDSSIINIFGVTGLKARPQFTVSFDPAGGDAVNSIKATEGTEVTLPGAAREGYELAGWYSGDAKVGDAGDKYTVTADAGLYARWTWTKKTKNISIVENDIAADIAGSQLSNVYFGNYKQSSDGKGDFKTEPVKWRVLDNGDGKLMLLSDRNLDCRQFRSREYGENGSTDGFYWHNVTFRSWLNGYDGTKNDLGFDYSSDNFKDDVFTADEQSAIAVTTCLNPRGSSPGDDTEDELFALSQVEATNPTYGFTDDFGPTVSRVVENTDFAVERGVESYNTNKGLWWLRTNYDNSSRYAVDHRGKYPSPNTSISSVDVGVRPALNVDLGSVLLTSSAAGGKVSGSTGAEALRSVEDNTGDDWKLTVKDTARNDFVVSSVTTCDGKTLDVKYSGAVAGEDEFISAIIKGSNDKVRYYGRIKEVNKDSDASGTAKIDVSNKLEDGDTLYVFNEQYNGDRKTDFASSLIAVSIDNSSGHSLENVDEKAPGCTEPGHIAGWVCSLCDRHFGDEHGNTEVADEDWLIPAKGHILEKTSARDATYTAPGNIEYWTCTVCGKYFADEKAKNEIEEDSWVIPVVTPKVIFDPNGGELTGEDSLETALNTDIDLPEVSRKCHEFEGWYDGDTRVGDIADTYTVTKSVTLQARWKFTGSDGIVLVDKKNASNIKGGQGGNPDGGIWFGNYMQRGLDKEEPAMHFAGEDDPITKALSEGGQGGNADLGILFGNYKQSSDGEGGFKKDPIKWRILKKDGGDLFLLSDKILDYKSHRLSELEDWDNDERVQWETSTLRSWLNGYSGENNIDDIDYIGNGFVNKAFNGTEQSLIPEVTVRTEKPPFDNTVFSETNDRVFLLSEEEVNKEEYGIESV